MIRKRFRPRTRSLCPVKGETALTPLMPVIDTETVARLYAAFAGCTWADTAEAEAAAAIEARVPGISARFLRARAFHARAARQAVTHAARGVVFGAPGFPLSPDPHEDAAHADPQAQFAYADASPLVTKVNEALLAVPGRVTACTASLRDPEGLLSCPEVAELPRPLHVQAQLAAHFWSPCAARTLIGDYARLLPDRSVLLLSWGSYAATDAGRELAAVLGEACGTKVYRHTPRAVAKWLGDAGMKVMPPGARDVRGWHMAWPELERRRAAGRIVAVIAQKA
jgi:S-adenosyl methyltransferase